MPGYSSTNSAPTWVSTRRRIGFQRGSQRRKQYKPRRNRILFVSDDQDGTGGWPQVHEVQRESQRQICEPPSYDVTKIYADAYIQTNTPGGERYEGALREIARRVDEVPSSITWAWR